MSQNLEEQLVKLESKVAYQEVMIEELNSVLYQQQIALDQIQKTLSVFVKRYKELEKSSLDIGPANEKPPHY